MEKVITFEPKLVTLKCSDNTSIIVSDYILNFTKFRSLSAKIKEIKLEEKSETILPLFEFLYNKKTLQDFDLSEIYNLSCYMYSWDVKNFYSYKDDLDIIYFDRQNIFMENFHKNSIYQEDTNITYSYGNYFSIEDINYLYMTKDSLLWYIKNKYIIFPEVFCIEEKDNEITNLLQEYLKPCYFKIISSDNMSIYSHHKLCPRIFQDLNKNEFFVKKHNMTSKEILHKLKI